MGQPRGEALRRPAVVKLGLDRPVFARPEGLDLGFALADQAQRHRLHAAGRAAARQLAPQHRREGEADQIVERAAGQIGVDQLAGRARAGAAWRRARRCLVISLKTTRLTSMPFSALRRFSTSRTCQEIASPSRSGSVARISLLGALAAPRRSPSTCFSALAVDLPVHGEVLVGPHRAVLRRQVAHMAVAGQHLVAAAEILVDGLGLGRRFDDDDVHRPLMSDRSCPTGSAVRNPCAVRLQQERNRLPGWRSRRPASSSSSRTARTAGADKWHCRTSSSTATGVGPSSS